MLQLHARSQSAIERALEYPPILDLLSKYDIPQLPVLLTQSIREMDSVRTRVRRLEDAVLGLYRSNYSRRDEDFALYILRLEVTI